MKVYVSNNGITYNTNTYIEDAVKAFNIAKTTASSLSCPTGFTYATYINGLENTIKGYRDELSRVHNALKRADAKYNSLFEKSSDACKNVKVVELTEKLPATSLKSIIN